MKKKRNELSIGEAIEAYLGKNNLKEKALVQQVITDWPVLMGRPIADNTEQLWFRNGTFFIKMANPVWKQELQLANSKIKEILNKALGAALIQEIKII